jgi:hypothetical protein
MTAIESQIKTDSKALNQDQTPKPINAKELKEKLTTLNKNIKEQQTPVAKGTQKQLEKLSNEHLPRLEKYEQQLETLGNRNSYSKTDEDATFMRLKDDHMKNGQLKPAYNTQISTEEQFITHYSIHQKPNDTTTLEKHLKGFEEQNNTQSKVIVADAGYGSEENYELLETQAITAYVKYNYFHKEQKRTMRNDPFLPQNIFYNKEKDFYVCPMGQRLENIGQGKRVSSNGYESTIKYYEAKRCEGCPMRGVCHQAKGNRRIEVNHRLNELKAQARELLLSEEGLKHRSKRPVEVEAVFGQLKSNNKFTRFTFFGIEKVNLEFGLMALAHNLRKMAKKALEKGQMNHFYNYYELYNITQQIIANHKIYKMNNISFCTAYPTAA